MASNMENAILSALCRQDNVDSGELAAQLKVDHQEVVGASKSLEAEGYIKSEVVSRPVWNLTKEGKAILQEGSPEFLLFELLGEMTKEGKKKMSQEDAQAKLGKGVTGIAMANGLKAKIFELSKQDGQTFISRAKESFTDDIRDALSKANKNEHVDPTATQSLKRRKLATIDSAKTFKLCKGPNFAPERKAKAAGDITAKMLQDGSWKTAEFKEYNFDAPAPEIDGGQLHPLLKTRQEFREIMMELGFQEMNTQHWVESSFWNFDSLFIPQQHPARDVQDTFFMSKPAVSKIANRELLEKVKATHDRSFHSHWSEAESSRNVLRTHTTGTSAYTLYRLAQLSSKDEQGRVLFKPGRYYSIDRVFRNEQMDRTHLCEFHQVEGFVIGRDISLAKMMHTFDKFFRRIGVEKLRFKPAFNPYTEPSMEVFGYHTGLQKWIEVGNSGLFRPELLGPLGFDEGVSVMAWGLSLERPTMIKYGINSIHELFGHRVDIRFIKRSAIARF